MRLPMPGALVSAFSSPLSTASASPSGVLDERIDSAAFGPTPEMPSSNSKQCFSLLLAKP